MYVNQFIYLCNLPFQLASATQTVRQEGQATVIDSAPVLHRLGSSKSPSPAGRRSRQLKGVQLTLTLSVLRYLPAVWKEEEMSDEEDVEWDDEEYEDEDQGLAIKQMQRRREEEEFGPGNMTTGCSGTMTLRKISRSARSSLLLR